LENITKICGIETMNKNDINIDPAKREWMYDGNGNKVYKDNYTKMWEPAGETPPKLSEPAT
jgi:hypothetical protein